MMVGEAHLLNVRSLCIMPIVTIVISHFGLTGSIFVLF